jgi:sulfur carrier protein
MRIELNGERCELPAGASLLDAVSAKLGSEPAQGSRGLAVALDGEVVPRGEWATTPLADGGRVEVLAAIQGGAADPTDVGARTWRARP